MRRLRFVTGEYYHIYNRGVDKRKIFLTFGHYRRFLTSMKTILNTGSATPRLVSNQGLALKLKVEIIAYCLMPNHYHFLFRQIQDNGLTEFMHNLNTSYTMYFNLNQKRSGRLFEYTFKAKYIGSNELFLHIARYIHLNPVIAHLVEDVELWPWSSYLSTIGVRNDDICRSQKILDFFHNQNPRENYKQFIADQRKYAKLLHEIEEVKDEDRLFI